MTDELEQLFTDPGLRELAGNLSRAARLEVDADPAFRSELRRRLLREAYDRRRRTRFSIWQRLVAPSGLAWAGAAVGVLLIAAVAVSLVTNQTGTTTIVVGCSCSSAQAMSFERPIELSFSQPMDQSSVEKSISISPATSVSYQWTSPTTIKIVPIAGDLAPNTQYQLKIAAAAATSTGQQLGRPQTITFITQPPPSPAPTPPPSPSPAPPITAEKALAAVGAVAWSAWSSDAATLYAIGPGGSLQAVPAGGGVARTLVPDGVTLAAESGQGDQLLYYRSGKLSTLDLSTYRVTDVAAPATPPLTIGWRAAQPIWVEDGAAFVASAAGPGRLPWSPPAGSTSVSIAPGGVAVAYLGPGRTLNLHDYEGQKDLVLSQSAAGFTWARKGILFGDPNGLQLSDFQGTTRVLAAQVTSAEGAAVSSRDQVLVPVNGALFALRIDGSGLQQLGSGDYGALQPSPDGTSFAFTRAGQLWTATLNPTLLPTMSTLGADDAWRLLSDYMATRIGSGDDLKLSRWFAVYYEPVPGTPPGGRFNVRLVYSKSGLESAYADQAITVRQGADGKPAIQPGALTSQRKAGAQPEVLSIGVQPGQLRLGFDSDLDPASVGAGVTISLGGQQVVPGAASYDAPGRAVVLAISLKPGTQYTIQATGIRDVNGRPTSTPYTLTFTTPPA